MGDNLESHWDTLAGYQISICMISNLHCLDCLRTKHIKGHDKIYLITYDGPQRNFSLVNDVCRMNSKNVKYLSLSFNFMKFSFLYCFHHLAFLSTIHDAKAFSQSETWARERLDELHSSRDLLQSPGFCKTQIQP